MNYRQNLSQQIRKTLSIKPINQLLFQLGKIDILSDLKVQRFPSIIQTD